MEHAICATGGTRLAETDPAPWCCPVCGDERQYVGHPGQRWTTFGELQRDHRNAIRPTDAGLTGIATKSRFAIGQRAHLIETPAGNVLWNRVSLVDDITVEAVARRGGLAAIAISHPHFNAAMVDWGRAFGGVPIRLHADDRDWVMRPDAAIRVWEGDDAEVLPGGGLTLIRCGGHFPASCVPHRAAGADGRGALLTGDTIMVVADRRWVSFMESYPPDPARRRRGGVGGGPPLGRAIPRPDRTLAAPRPGGASGGRSGAGRTRRRSGWRDRRTAGSRAPHEG